MVHSLLNSIMSNQVDQKLSVAIKTTHALGSRVSENWIAWFSVVNFLCPFFVKIKPGSDTHIILLNYYYL
jgi:hypothetical protein